MCAGERYVTFNGLAKACAKAMDKPEPEIINYNPKVGRCFSWNGLRVVRGHALLGPCDGTYHVGPEMSRSSAWMGPIWAPPNPQGLTLKLHVVAGHPAAGL